MESREKKYDIVIVGGGLIGGTLAQALACQGISVVVIDENDPAEILNSDTDGRSYAVSLGSKYTLDHIGLWNSLAEKAHPIETIKIGTAVDDTPLVYHYADIADEPLGYLVDATVIRRTILDHTSGNKDINWVPRSTVQEFTCSPHGVSVTTDKGETFKCQLLLGCDGRASKLRQDMNIPLLEWDYNQLGLVFNVSHTEPHLNTAFEIFTPEGPFAMLPYPNNTSGCVWSLQKDRAEDFMGLPQRDQDEILNDRFGKLLGHLKLTTPVKAFPLQVKQPHRSIGPRVALVGDAAHVIHPVAGQGLNLGFRDVKVLTDELSKAKNLGLDLGSQTLLKAYQRKRRYDNLSLLGVTDLSARVFATHNPLLRRAFSKGFSILGKTRPLKKYMMRQAMGIMGKS